MYQLDEINWQRAPADQTLHLLSLGGSNKGLAPQDRPSTWSLREVGVSPGDDRTAAAIEVGTYQMMLLLASGIQAAGPKLTPDTFAAGLQRTAFPNSGAGAAPYYQASVGFKDDHSMIDDEALLWWSANAPAYGTRTADVGGWCYIDSGARWRLGTWPSREHSFFDRDKPCR